jgi:hypothetical protein
MVAVPVGAINGVLELYEFRTYNSEKRPVRIAGEWLDHYAPGAKVVADSQNILPYHAHANFVPLPYAEPSTAIRYLKQRGTRFIVLRDADKALLPYLPVWLDSGFPGSGAHLIYNESSPALGRILIYEWKDGDARG